MLKAHAPPLQKLLTPTQAIPVPAKATTAEKARARKKGSLKLGSVVIVTNGILPKQATFLITDHYQVKKKNSIPKRAMKVTSTLSIRNPHLG